MSNIRRLKKAVIREELVALTGHYVPALILNQFLYWSDRTNDVDQYIEEELTRIEEAGSDELLTHGWIYKSADDLSEELMLDMARSTIRKYVKQLVDNGWVDERNNPRHAWDRTLQYRPNILKIQRDLWDLGYTLNGYRTATEILPYKFDSRTSKFKSKTTIPETTIETTKTPMGETSSPRKASPSTDAPPDARTAGENKTKDKPLFEPVLDNEPEEEMSETRELSRNEATSLLTDVFCDATGLKVPPSISHAAFNKLWRTPLWEIFQLCDKDVDVAAVAVKEVCSHMRNEDLTISRPLSIINIARDRIAQGKHLSQLDDVQAGEEGGLWL